MTTDITQVLHERGERYGPFLGHSEVSQDLKETIEGHLERRHKKLRADQKEALDMIFHKIARIINGDPDYYDSWVDIAGYAKLIADRLRGVCSEQPVSDRPDRFRFSELAKEFRQAFGVEPDIDRGVTLITEEYNELLMETGHSVDDLKELADLVYVCYQYAEDCGYDLDEALIRVHASNMTKLAADGSVIRNEDGKVLKGPNYEPPKLDDLINNGN